MEVSKVKEYIKLIRIKHWIKNGLIFLPLIFSMSFEIENIVKTILAFFAFSFMASVIYIINDINDREKDKKHPRKCKRPIASGTISIQNAIAIGIILFIVSLVLHFFAIQRLLHYSALFLIGYFFINILYSYGAKNISIVDVIILASGFIFRVYYGASIINVPVSNWLFLTILSASLFMGFGKRNKELKMNGEVRGVLKDYTEKFLDNFTIISVILFIVFYSLWSYEQNNVFIIYLVPLLLIIVMQYMLCMEKSNEGDPMTLLLQNKSLIVTFFIYVFCIAGIMVVNYIEYL